MRRFLRGLGLLGVLALIPLGYYLYRASLDADRLREVLANLDSTEPGWRLTELLARMPSFPDEQNSALVITRLRLPTPRTLDDLSKLTPNATLTPAEAGRLKAYLESVEDKLGAARRVAELPDGKFPVTVRDDFLSTLLPHIQTAREFCFAMRAAAVWQAQQANFEQAVDDVRACVHVSRPLRHEPFLISQLVRFAVVHEACGTMERIVAQGQPAPPLLAQAQKMFAQERVIDDWYNALARERAGMHQLFESIADSRTNPSLIRGVMGARRRWHDPISDHFTGLSARASHIWMLEHFTAKLATRDPPAKERRERLAELSKETENAPALARELLVSPFREMHDVPLRVQAKLHATVAGLAVERFRRKHERWPKDLGELVPEFLEAAPLDPYDDEPLRFSATKDGVAVYSVGPDGALTGNSGGEHAFRLWNVAERRK
jgi:hypothetical protein